MGKLKQTKLSEIKPYERNPRVIPQAAIDAVARSITAYGFRQPIVVDGDGVILAGHTRYLAAKQLGLTAAPVLWETDITPEQARGYRIADNKTSELAAWDRDKLDEEVRTLAAEIDDTSLDALGMADWELKRIFNEQIKPISPGELDAITEHAITSWEPRVTSSRSTPSDAMPSPAAVAGPFADTVETESSAELGPIGGAESSNRPELKDKTLTICYSDRELAILAGVLGIPEKVLPGRRVYTVSELLRDRGAQGVQDGGANNA